MSWDILLMCGIAGILRPSEQAGDGDREVVRDMTSCMEHRGPDDAGLESLGRLTLGHRRLSVLDLTPAGHQPMWSSDGNWVICFNGEIYNYRDLQHQLGLADSDLVSSTDTEILLHAWMRWGADSLDRLVGQFAFAIWDAHNSELWLARDRFGEKPLFYYQEDDYIAFASSIGALTWSPRVPSRLDPARMAEYVTLRYVVAPRTVVTSVKKLPAGHVMRVGESQTDVHRWYDPRFDHSSHSRNDDDVLEEFHTLFVQASERCMVSDVPVALLLSEGIDSNGIRYALSAKNIDPLCITYRMTEDDVDLPPVPAPPDSNRRDTMKFRFRPADRVKNFLPCFSSFTEPVGDGASLASWLLIKRAREHATVFLSGQGGDEILGGYRLSQDRFRLATIRRLAWLPAQLARGIYRRYVPGPEPVTERRQRLLERPPHRAPAAARYLIHRPLPEKDVEDLLGRSDFRYLQAVDRLYGETSQSAADLDQIQEVMIRTFLTENLLSWGDSIAMSSSAEMRMPFLDRDLVNFVLSLPPDWRVSRWPGHGNTKLILRRWANNRMPVQIVNRKKRGFNFGNLPPMLRDDRATLQSFILDSSAVRRALPGIESWLDHDPSYYRRGREGTLWAILCLAIWCEALGIT